MHAHGKDVPLFPYLLAVAVGFLPTCLALLFCISLSGQSGLGPGGVGFRGLTACAVAHALTGGGFGFAWPEKGWRWGVWLCLVPVCVISFLGWEASMLLWVVALTLAPACAGAYVAARVQLNYTRVI